MREYELLPGAEQGVDQLNWCRIHREHFPLLSKLVRVVLSVHAASSISERILSDTKKEQDESLKLEDLFIFKLNITLLKKKIESYWILQ